MKLQKLFFRHYYTEHLSFGHFYLDSLSSHNTLALPPYSPIDQYGVDERLRVITVDAGQVAAVLGAILLRAVPVERLVDDRQTPEPGAERHGTVRALGHDVRYRLRLIGDDQRGHARRHRRRLHQHNVRFGHH